MIPSDEDRATQAFAQEIPPPHAPRLGAAGKGKLFRPEERAKRKEFRYMRRWLDMPCLMGEGVDRRRARRRKGIPDSAVADKPYEAEISKAMALYLLDGGDKRARLDASDREHPLKSYTRRSEVWKEALPSAE